MKKLLLAIVIFPLSAISQITITQSDVAVIGDTVLIARDTTPTGINVGSAGANQVWDFTSLDADALDNNAFIDPATTIFSSNFPNSNLAIDVNNGTTITYLSVSSSEFNVDGLYGDPVGAGIPVIINFNPPQTRVQFPAFYQSSFLDTMSFVYKFPVPPEFLQYGLDSVMIIHTSFATRTIDAYGTMTTKADNFDCLRQYSEEITTDSIYAHSTGGSWSLVPTPLLQAFPEFGFQTNPDTSYYYSYAWYANGEKMPVAELTTDSVGTPITASFKITDKVVAGLFSVAHVTCNALCDGSASVTAISGYSPYSYVWDNAQTTPNATGLCAGTYTVTITDAMGNISVASVTVNEPSVLSNTFTAVNTQCDTCPYGTLSAIPSGGVSPYIYVWNTTPPDYDSIATGLVTGDYVVTITDANGCQFIDTGTVGLWATGIEDISDGEFFIYPNPSNGEFEIRSSVISHQSSVRIYNVLGEKVFSVQQITNNKQLTTNLSSGIYFVKISPGEKIRKLVIK